MTNGSNGGCCTPRVGFATLPSVRRPGDLFESFFAEPFGFAPLSAERGATRPAMDAYETEQAYVIELDVPGSSMDQIEITHLGDTLTIKGKQEASSESSERNVLRRERRAGEFARTIRFTDGVSFEKAEATLVNGVLKLTLPKPAQATPRKIAVKGA